MAAAERIERRYLGSLLRLILLAPDLVEAILDGRQPADLWLPRLMNPFPVGWEGQRHFLLNCGERRFWEANLKRAGAFARG
jgi:hypothetical protein